MSELEYHSVAFGAHKNTVNLLHYFLIPDKRNMGGKKGRKEKREGEIAGR